MADSIEFQLKLADQMSAALKSGVEGALKLDEAVSKLTHKLESLEHEEKEEKREEEGMFTRAVEKGEILKDLYEEIAERVMEFGKEIVESAVEVTDFGFRAEVALRHLNDETEGSAEKTETMLAEARKFALDAALPVDQVTEAFLGLKRAGLSDEWVRPLTAAAGDLSALSGHPENFRQLTAAFENISLKGELTGRALMALTSAGVSPAALAAKFGAKDFEALQKQLSQHPVGALEGLRAIEEVIKETAHEKTLGEVLKEDSSTIGGSITKIKDIWDVLLDGLNENDTFKGLRTSFGKIVDDLIENLPNLEQQFAETFGPILDAVDKFIKDPKAIANLFTEAVGAIKEVASVVGSVVDAFRFISDHLGLLETVGGALAGSAVGAGFGAALPAAAGVGAAAGFANVKTNETERLQSEGGLDFEAADRAASRGMKFADGGPVPETGMALVHEGEYVIPVGGAPVVGGSGDGGRGGATISAPISVTVHVEGGQGMTEQGLRLMLEEMLPGLLVSPFEKLATTVGAA